MREDLQSVWVRSLARTLAEILALIVSETWTIIHDDDQIVIAR